MGFRQHLCCSHGYVCLLINNVNETNIIKGNKIGGAKAAMTELIEKSEPLFQKLSKRNTGVYAPNQAISGEPSEELLASGTECG